MDEKLELGQEWNVDGEKFTTHQIFSKLLGSEQNILENKVCSGDGYKAKTIPNRFLIYGKYGRLKRIGSGGFGDVYLCYDIESYNEEVKKKYNNTKPEPNFAAIKLFNKIQHDYKEYFEGMNLPEEEAKNKAAEEIGKVHGEEVRLGSILGTSQNVVIIYEPGYGKEPYIVFEYCDGGTLTNRLKKKDYNLVDFYEWSYQLTSVLKIAHHTLPGGVLIHRDLKPDNILFSQNNIKISDFGTSKIKIKVNQTLSTVKGGITPVYAAPEAIDGKVKPTNDIWSFGVILYELISGNRPFEGSSPQQLTENIKKKPFKPLDKLDNLVIYPSKEIIDLVHKCLNKNWEKRPSAEECFEILNKTTTNKEKAKETYKLGIACSQKKEYDKAIESYSKSIELDPSHTLAYYNRGNAYSDKKDYNKAIKDYSEVIKLDPSADNYYKRGIAYYNKGNYSKAIKDYSETIKLKSSANIYNQRGTAYLFKKDYDNAIKDYNEAIKLNPSYVSAYFGRGYTYSCKKDYDNAIKDYTEGIKLDSPAPNPTFYNNRGVAYEKKKDYDNAIKNYTEAIKLDASDSLYYNNRGRVYRFKKDYDNAIKDHDEAIKLKPSAYIYNRRGNAYKKKKDYNKAIKDYIEAIKLDLLYFRAYYNCGCAYLNKSKFNKVVFFVVLCIVAWKLYLSYSYDVYKNRGNAYFEKKEYDKAIENYSEVIKLKRSAYIYYRRGNAYFEKKDYDNAIKDYIEAIKLKPSYALAYFYRGYAYHNLFFYDKAIKDYTKAIKLDSPEPDPVFYNNRGVTYKNKKDYDKAIKDYNEAIKLDPSYALAYNNRGDAYFEKKDYDKAIKDYTEVINLDFLRVYAYKDRGNAYRYKKDYDNAIKDYNKAIKLDPSYASAYFGRGYAYYFKEDYDNAIKDYTKAINLDSPDPDPAFYNNRGVTYEKKKDYDNAIKDYTKAIKLDSSNPDPLYYNNRGRVYKKKGEEKKAKQDFQEAKRLKQRRK